MNTPEVINVSKVWVKGTVNTELQWKLDRKHEDYKHIVSD